MNNSTKQNKYKYQHKPISGKMFHAPETDDKAKKIPMSRSMHIISFLSLCIQLILTALAIYAANSQSVIIPLAGSGISSGLIYLTLPITMWTLTLGFRLACRIIPLSMWRLSERVRKGMLLCDGTLLKLLTLLVELETAICFVYICCSLYLGYAPNNLILLLWIMVLFLSIYYPCKKAILYAEGKAAPNKRL